ncbi:MAG: histidine triad nucleotide-binding protein [Cyanobacteria bacterium NC_groundwater_1444_Ag_S-0.65um_54_12]|nr:histidine triad nucleotide-binding protein [Cyanobacteria bacterium NC_groundwater_1444_Ag_S-0.65um_54_12]
MSEQCIFCNIAQGSIPAQVIYQDEAAIAFRDINPQAPVHVLVIPRLHVPSIAELPDQLCHPLLHAINAVVRQEGIAASYRVVTNVGPAAGQSVFHLHFHVLSGRTFSWPPG